MFSWSLQYWWRVDENLKKTIDSFMFCGKKWSRQDTSGVYSYCYLEVYLQKYFWKYSWCPPAGDIWLVKPYKEEDLWVRPYSNTFLMLIFLALGCSRHGVLLLVVVFIFFIFMFCVYIACMHVCLPPVCLVTFLELWTIEPPCAFWKSNLSFLQKYVLFEQSPQPSCWLVFAKDQA